MKERPILFSSPMVRAILDGRKTQTRRVVDVSRLRGGNFDHRGIGAFEWMENLLWRARAGGWNVWSKPIKCPFGNPGDRLWVRETFANEVQVEHDQPPPHNDGRPVWYDDDGLWHQAHYRATDPAPDLMYEDHPRDEPHCRWMPSIHMPRKASRITLEISGVRVERLNDICELHAQKEGAPLLSCGYDAKADLSFASHVKGFSNLWESINGHGSWEKNPWVWVIEFRRL